MSQLNVFAVDSGLVTSVSPSVAVNFSPVALGQSGLSTPHLTALSGSGSSVSSSSSSSSFVNDEGAGASSSAVSISPNGTVSDSETVFTPSATSSSASATAIASSTEPGSAIATAVTANSGKVFAIVPANLDQPFLIVNLTPDILSGLIDIRSINPLFLTVNVVPDLVSGLSTVQFSSGLSTVQFGDRANVLFEVSSTVLSSSSDTSASQNPISIPVQDLNVSISLIQQESSQPAFSTYEVVRLSEPIGFDPISLEFSLELKLSFVPVTAVD